MSTAKAWLKLAKSAELASAMMRQPHPRSAISRAYYAAFAACHAVIGHLRPEIDWPSRQHFKHGDLPGELRWTLQRPSSPLKSGYQADVYRACLERAYNFRRQADYRPATVMTSAMADQAIDSARSLVRLAERILA